MSRLIPALLAAAGVSALVAAPVPKGAKEDFGPITDEQLKESVNNLKQILLAMHNYESANGFLPNNGNPTGQGKAVVSWRVHLLPYLEQDHLYREMMADFKWDEPWDSKDNLKFVEKMPKIYAPVRVKTKEKGHTFYRGFTGADAVFEAGLKLRFVAITDGLSNTAAVVEAGESVPWTCPDDLPFDPKKDLPKLGGLFDGDFHVAFADGSVRKATGKKVNDAEFRKLITRSGGEVGDTDAALGNK
jgi:hypothetical protein